MTLVVPFDGSDLAKAALVRAAQFDEVLEDGVLAVSVIPANNASYARERGWLGADDPFDAEQVVSHLRNLVHEIAPAAEFEYVVASRYAQPGEIGSKLRRFARHNEASIVFIGSKNAGRTVRSIGVGTTVATDRTYDTMLISQPLPSKIDKLEALKPTTDALE